MKINRAFCITCGKSFPIEDRVAGKLIGLAGTAIFGGGAKLPWWGTLFLGLGSLWLGHKIDQKLRLMCPSPGCRTALRIVEAAL